MGLKRFKLERPIVSLSINLFFSPSLSSRPNPVEDPRSRKRCPNLHNRESERMLRFAGRRLSCLINRQAPVSSFVSRNPVPGDSSSPFGLPREFLFPGSIGGFIISLSLSLFYLWFFMFIWCMLYCFRIKVFWSSCLNFSHRIRWFEGVGSEDLDTCFLIS